jgi:hypothetical protein
LTILRVKIGPEGCPTRISPGTGGDPNPRQTVPQLRLELFGHRQNSALSGDREPLAASRDRANVFFSGILEARRATIFCGTSTYMPVVLALRSRVRPLPVAEKQAKLSNELNVSHP